MQNSRMRHVLFALVLALSLLQPLHGNQEAAAESATRKGDKHFHEGRLEQAEQSYLEARQMYTALHGGEHPNVGAVCNKLGALYDSMGKHDVALEMHEASLEILKSSDGSRSEAVAGQLFNIGNVFWGQGRLQDALSRYNEALNIYEQTFGKDHERVGATLGNIGSIYYLLGQYENALEAQEEALRIDRLNLQGGQEGVASGEQLGLSLFNTGHTLHKLGRLPEANARYKESLFFLKRAKGENSPAVAQVLSSMGNVATDMGELESAVEVHTKALGILIKTLGENHQQTAATIQSIGSVYSMAGKHQDALDMFMDAAGIMTRTLGVDAVENALPYISIAGAKAALGDTRAAKISAEEALRIFSMHGHKDKSDQVRGFIARLDGPASGELPPPPM